jgi:hypothetical protein
MQITKIMLIFDEKTHSFILDGFKIPSVTQIIAETTGTAWKAAPWYMERGKAIHACAAFIAQGKEFKYDERLSRYVAALRKFFKEVNPEVLGKEIRVSSQTFQYAGILDLACKIYAHYSIIDWKHSCDKIRIPLQLGAYSQAYKETFGKEINSGYGVEIHENGTYVMTERIDLRIPRNEFLSLRTTYRIKERCGELSFQKKEKSNG